MKLTRRGFLSAPFTFASSVDETPVDIVNEHPDSTEVSTELFSEFPAELLAMEAERLGLSPDADSDEVCRAIQAALESCKKSS